jgi:uncharacterized protein (UPF0276 family)
VGPLNKDYLKSLKALVKRMNPPWVSDHLCWTGAQGKNLHDLIPLPYTEETLRHVVKKLKQVQDFLERPFLIENVSSYMEFTDSSMSEWEFLTRIVEGADCGILLDINNIYVSSVNHSFDPLDYLSAIPKNRVAQFHLAGHSNKGRFLLDTHDHPVKKDVWDLYREALRRFGPVSTMIERDDHIPPFEKLYEELTQAREIYQGLYVSKQNSFENDPASPLEAHYGT